MLQWLKYLNKLNSLGIGEFTARQVMWRVIFYFDGREIGDYDISGNIFRCESLPTPLPVAYQHPSEAEIEEMVLTGLLCAALSVRLWKDSDQRSITVTRMRRMTNGKWLLLPPNIGTTGKYFVIVPPLTLGTDPTNYKIEVQLMPWDEKGRATLLFSPQELPDGRYIEKAIAVISI